MRYTKKIFAYGVGAFVIATMAFMSNTMALENVRLTKHNLTSNPNIGIDAKDTAGVSTKEVCIFCHTPHGGLTDVAGGAAPLWNRSASTATYEIYDSPNFDDASNNAGQPKGVSQACLSCHDGTVAFDSLINLSGSGGYQGVNGARANWTASGSYVDTDGSFTDAAGPFPNLGAPLSGSNPDLSNDHPISMRICNGSLAHDSQFSEACSAETPATLAGIKKLKRTASVFPGDVRDTIRAYKSLPSTDSTGWYVECASCHNPHESTSTRFLRYQSAISTNDATAIGYEAADTETDRNKGSLLCLSCHQK